MISLHMSQTPMFEDKIDRMDSMVPWLLCPFHDVSNFLSNALIRHACLLSVFWRRTPRSNACLPIRIGVSHTCP